MPNHWQKIIQYCFIIILCSCVKFSFAQEQSVFADSLSTDNKLSILTDSLISPIDHQPKKNRWLRKLFHYDELPNPKRAVIYSLIVPGAGQVYNKQYIKLPFIYGLYTAAILNVRQHRRLEKRYKSYLVAALDEDPNTVNPTVYDATTLRNFWNKSRTDKETGYLLLGLLHALQATDAFVFAHLKGFDVSDDLSMKIQPSIRFNDLHQPYTGFSMVLGFSDNTKKQKAAF